MTKQIFTLLNPRFGLAQILSLKVSWCVHLWCLLSFFLGLFFSLARFRRAILRLFVSCQSFDQHHSITFGNTLNKTGRFFQIVLCCVTLSKCSNLC